jgi:hypothetical protein
MLLEAQSAPSAVNRPGSHPRLSAIETSACVRSKCYRQRNSLCELMTKDFGNKEELPRRLGARDHRSRVRAGRQLLRALL